MSTEQKNPDLIIYSERDILKWLKENDIHPKEFYTDLAKLRERSVIFSNCVTVIILTGNCGVSRKKVIDFVNNIQNRIDNVQNALKIYSIHVLSDTKIEGCKYYGLFKDNPTGEIDVYSGLNKIDEDDDFWDNFVYEPSQTVATFYKDNKPEIREEFIKYKEARKGERDLRKMIKVPKVRLAKKYQVSNNSNTNTNPKPQGI